MNVGEDSTLGDDDLTEQSVEFLVISDGELQVSGNDSGLLVVSGSISSELEDLSREVPNREHQYSEFWTRKSGEWRTRERRRGRQGLRLLHVERSFPFGAIGEYVQRGIAIQPWRIATSTSCRNLLQPFLLIYLRMTLLSESLAG